MPNDRAKWWRQRLTVGVAIGATLAITTVALVTGGPAGAQTGQTVVFALGDGADNGAASVALANYVKAQNPNRFFYLGDVYETGTAAEFSSKYEPMYGSMASKTDPVIGNHEYANRATGYYAYWRNKRGWTETQAKHRSYVDAASGWQIIAYSSETDMAAEGTWVAGEVAKRGGTCRIVMAHKGRHVVPDSSHNDNTNQESVWSKIVNKTAINLVGHNHIYGRLAPISGVNGVRLRRRRSRPALTRKPAPHGGEVEDRRRHGHAARAARRRGRLQAGRPLRDRLRLGHDRLHAGVAGSEPSGSEAARAARGRPRRSGARWRSRAP